MIIRKAIVIAIVIAIPQNNSGCGDEGFAGSRSCLN
jgi:hypothetical protein